LKKSGLSQHLLHFYLSVIRPVLEYCSVVWHHSLSKLNVKVWKLYSVEPSVLSILLPLACLMFSH